MCKTVLSTTQCVLLFLHFPQRFCGRTTPNTQYVSYHKTRVISSFDSFRNENHDHVIRIAL